MIRDILISYRADIIVLHDMEINLSSFFAKLILRNIPYILSHRVLVMCRGYSEDTENFTELVWEDDKDLDFYDKKTYPEFQLWLR